MNTQYWWFAHKFGGDYIQLTPDEATAGMIAKRKGDSFTVDRREPYLSNAVSRILIEAHYSLDDQTPEALSSVGGSDGKN